MREIDSVPFKRSLSIQPLIPSLFLFRYFVLAYEHCSIASLFIEQAGYKRKLECTSKWSEVQQNIDVVLFAMILSRDVPSHITESFCNLFAVA